MANIARSISWVSTVLYLNFLFVGDALAFGSLPSGLPGPTGSGGLRTGLVSALNSVLNFLALIAVIMIVVGGIRILASGGNDEQVGKGRKTIVMAIVGLIVVAFAKAIIGFVTGDILGL